MGQHLAYLRKQHGITSQAEFAARLGITRFLLANIESGRTALRMALAWKACQELDIHPGFLISCGSAWKLPFAALDNDALSGAEALIKDNPNARFVDFWPALYSYLFESSERTQAPASKKDEAMLDKSQTLADDSGVRKKIRSLPDLLKRLRGLTKDRGRKVALAKKMKVTRQAVDQWLSESTTPTAETTFELLKWVSDQECKK